MRRRRLIGLLVSAATFTACTSGTATVDQDVAARPATSSSAAVTTTTDPGPAPLLIGEGAPTRDGNVVKVVTYHQPVPAGAIEPDPGMEYGAIEVEICAGRRGAPRVTPDGFSVELPDGTRRGRSRFGPREPALAEASLGPGECVRGWVSFEVPTNERPVHVVFSGSSVVRWGAGGRRR